MNISVVIICKNGYPRLAENILSEMDPRNEIPLFNA